MSRQKLKMWRNGPGGRWSARITWFEEREPGVNEETGVNVCLVMEDPEREVRYYPRTLEEANDAWSLFKKSSLPQGSTLSVVSSLLKVLASKYPRSVQEDLR